MIEFLTVALLMALSVNKLEDELSAKAYPEDVLLDALEFERAKDDPRKTAIEALESALEDRPEADPEPEPEPKVSGGYKVPKGKAMTTRAGMKSEGEKITPDMVIGGTETLVLLKQKGLLV